MEFRAYMRPDFLRLLHHPLKDQLALNKLITTMDQGRITAVVHEVAMLDDPDNCKEEIFKSTVSAACHGIHRELNLHIK